MAVTLRAFNEGIRAATTWRGYLDLRISSCDIYLGKTERNIIKSTRWCKTTILIVLLSMYFLPNIFIFCKLCITNIRTHLFHTLSILYFIQFFELSRFFCFVLRPALARRAFQANGSSHCRWCAPPHYSTLKSINSAKTRSNFELGLEEVANFLLGAGVANQPIHDPNPYLWVDDFPICSGRWTPSLEGKSKKKRRHSLQTVWRFPGW